MTTISNIRFKKLGSFKFELLLDFPSRDLWIPKNLIYFRYISIRLSFPWSHFWIHLTTITNIKFEKSDSANFQFFLYFPSRDLWRSENQIILRYISAWYSSPWSHFDIHLTTIINRRSKKSDPSAFKLLIFPIQEYLDLRESHIFCLYFPSMVVHSYVYIYIYI